MIVQSVGIAARHGENSAAIAIMQAALLQAQADGISDPEALRARMIEARDKAKAT